MIPLCAATDVGNYPVNRTRVTIPFWFLVGLHCGPVEDFFIPTSS